jgi:hypothetical protein
VESFHVKNRRGERLEEAQELLVGIMGVVIGADDGVVA